MNCPCCTHLNPLVSLLPGIDFLFDFNDLSMNDGINNQLNLELLLEDDEWSTPASSVVGTLGLDF